MISCALFELIQHKQIRPLHITLDTLCIYDIKVLKELRVTLFNCRLLPHIRNMYM